MAARLSFGTRSETGFLQPLFDVWATRESHSKFGQVSLAGAPEWLSAARAQNEPDRNFDAYGYSFRIDVLWKLNEEWRLIELKHAWKYEPFALAEALHHAHLFSVCKGIDRKLIKPVVIGNFNAFTRAALADLVAAGLHREHIEYLEFDHLVVKERGAEREYLWFDDPLAPWKHFGGSPPELPPEISRQRSYWYYIARTNSWIGTDNEMATARPLFLDVPYTMAARVAGTPEGKPAEFLTWNGTPPTVGTGVQHDWKATFELVTLES